MGFHHFIDIQAPTYIGLSSPQHRQQFSKKLISLQRQMRFIIFQTFENNENAQNYKLSNYQNLRRIPATGPNVATFRFSQNEYAHKQLCGKTANGQCVFVGWPITDIVRNPTENTCMSITG